MGKNLTWSEAIEQVMLKNGYFATLKLLYEEAPKLKSFYGKTSHKTIDERVQRDKRFTRIAPGIWALKDFLDKLPDYLNPKIEKSEEDKQKITHSLIQGMLIEIGNIQGYKTYTHDKTTLFLRPKLSDLIILQKIHKFSYEHIIKSVQYIDVIWFNSRLFPCNVIEVEHSTNFRNSLVKFVELQDFQTKMTITAPQNRFGKFNDEINKAAFANIAKRVTFIPYEKLENFYNKQLELKELQIFDSN